MLKLGERLTASLYAVRLEAQSEDDKFDESDDEQVDFVVAEVSCSSSGTRGNPTDQPKSHRS